MRSGLGSPDEARAARYVLKDYVNARLLFCHPPPDIPAGIFNVSSRESELRRVLGKKQNSAMREMQKTAEEYDTPHTETGFKNDIIMDEEFFASPA